MQTIVVGITGPSCSGKSTISRAVADMLPGSVHLEQDHYFRDPDEYPADANFCELRWLHVDEFVADFLTLAGGQASSVPRVDFQTFKRRGQCVLGPARYLIVEGMTIFRIPEVYARCDFRYYMDCDFDTLARRKRDRDRRERGKSHAIIEAQLAWMKPEYESDGPLREQPSVSLVGVGDATLIAEPAITRYRGVPKDSRSGQWSGQRSGPLGETTAQNDTVDQGSFARESETDGSCRGQG